MNNKRIYGPTFPISETSEPCDDVYTNVTEADIKQYKEDISICQTVGPLLPGCEILEEMRHQKDANDEVETITKKSSGNIWMTELLPPSKIDINKSLKPRGFIMDSRNYLDNLESYHAPKRDNRESLMDIYKRNLEIEKKKKSSDSSSDEKHSKKSRKKRSKRSSSSEPPQKKSKKSKKHKSKRKDSSSEEEKEIKRKSKKNKSKRKSNCSSKPIGLEFKWSPFAVQSNRKLFNRDEEMKSGGAMSETAKSQMLKQAHGMLNDFVVPSKK